MRLTFIVLNFIWNCFLLTGAVLIPVYLTPGYYWWTAIMLAIMVFSTSAMHLRLAEWDQLDYEIEFGED